MLNSETREPPSLIVASVVADALGGAIAISALVAVISSTMRLAGDAGTPDDERSNPGKSGWPATPVRRTTSGRIGARRGSAGFDRNPDVERGPGPGRTCD